jgi:uncharacterized protein with HEPN domain
MDDHVKKYLADIRDAAEYILDVIPEIKSYKEYVSHRFYKPAFERKVEIIGEALSKALKLSPDLPITNKERIVSMRHRIIHAYDAVDDALVWEVVRKHLPKLHEEVQNLLKSD